MTVLNALYRWIEVDGFEYEVPKNITRIDPARYKTNTCGWQVRFVRKDETYYSKLYSDNVHGGIDEALNVALEDWEYQLINKRKSPFHSRINRKHKANKLPTGVVFNKSKKKNRSQAEYSFMVTISLPYERIHKSFYIGTENTLSTARFNKKKKEAVAFKLYADLLISENKFSQVSKNMVVPDSFLQSMKKEINRRYLTLSQALKS